MIVQVAEISSDSNVLMIISLTLSLPGIYTYVMVTGDIHGAGDLGTVGFISIVAISATMFWMLIILIIAKIWQRISGKNTNNSQQNNDQH